MPDVAAAPCFSFIDDTLHVNTATADIRIQWLPEPYASIRLGQPLATPFEPDFRILQPSVSGDAGCRRAVSVCGFDGVEIDGEDHPGKSAAYALLRESIPDEIALLAERFPSHQWCMLVGMHLRGSVFELAETNPVLAYCLANNGHFRIAGDEIARTRMTFHDHHQQKRVLEWLGFPGTQRVVRILKKIAPEAATPFDMRMLRTALCRGDRVGELLAHAPIINADVMGLVRHPDLEGLITPHLLTEVGANPGEMCCSATSELLLDVVRMHRELRAPRMLPVFSSVRRVREEHESYSVDYLAFLDTVALERADRAVRAQQPVQRNAQRRRPGTPKRRTKQRSSCWGRRPPIPGSKAIVPLRTKAQLGAESHTMRHCVGTLDDCVTAGTSYFYKLMRPERATVEICRIHDEDSWRLGQVRLKFNRSVSGETMRLLRDWLERGSESVLAHL